MKNLFLWLLIISCASHQGYDARLSQFKYPFRVFNFSLSSQNQELEMSYMDLNGSSQKVVVLLHGKNFAGFYWERIALDLVERGYRVIMPDQIGFGKSSKPENYQYSFRQLSLNTYKLLASLKIKNFILVGHSMGGMLAVTMADDFPSLVEKVVLINPIGLEDYGKYAQFKDPSFFYQNELNKTEAKIKAYQLKNYYDGKWSQEYQKLVTPFAKQIAGPDWEIVAWNNALTYGPIFSENIIDKLARTQLPIKIILGTRDRTGPGRNWKKSGVDYKFGQYHLMRENLEKLTPRINVQHLEGLGHLPQIENYSMFSEVFYRLF